VPVELDVRLQGDVLELLSLLLELEDEELVSEELEGEEEDE
jgi:hypothetical protein